MLTLRPTAATQRDFNNRLQALQRMARPQPDLVEVVQRAILDEFTNNFASESAGGVRWAALAEATILDRLRQGYGPGPILQRSGDYLGSWVDPGNANHVHELQQEANGWMLAEGSSHPLTAFHEQGTGQMPARPVGEISPTGEERLREAVDSWILNKLMNR